jgi:4-amino-4-deoxy-L-arabinose transferase-like glycosyltransferase
VPLAISRIWTYKGFFSLFDPVMVAFIFFTSIILVEYGAISILKTSYQGKLAVILLTATPFFVIDSAGLCADIPLAFYFITFCILYTLAQEFRSRKLLVISGISLGLSTWTKNEGFLFSLVALSIHFFFSFYRLGFYIWLRDFYRICIGFVPLSFTMMLLKYLYAPPNDLLSSFNQQIILEKITDINRYAVIFNNFKRELVYIGDWIIQVPIVLIFFAITMGYNKKKNFISLLLLSILIIMIAGCFVIYLLTPHNLQWHISNSMNRLIIQLWPIFIFVYFYYVKVPDERSISHT